MGWISNWIRRHYQREFRVMWRLFKVAPTFCLVFVVIGILVGLYGTAKWDERVVISAKTEADAYKADNDGLRDQIQRLQAQGQSAVPPSVVAPPAAALTGSVVTRDALNCPPGYNILYKLKASGAQVGMYYGCNRHDCIIDADMSGSVVKAFEMPNCPKQ